MAPFHSRPSARDLRFVLAVAVFMTTAAIAEARYGAGQFSPVAAIVSEELYSSLFLHKDDAACPTKGFYTYASFIRATRRFPKFGGTGDLVTRKREIAAFLASARSQARPRHPGRSYHGRGPIQISWNYNYGPAGQALGFDGLLNPDLVANCSDTAFQTALWFWMTPRQPKPSCHQVMVGEYCPSTADAAANRTAGFGLVTNIVNGGLECNIANDARVNDRIGYYRRYCQVLGIDVGPNLDCEHQTPYS